MTQLTNHAVIGLPLGPIGTNAWVLWRPGHGDDKPSDGAELAPVVVVDPGGDVDILTAELAKRHLGVAHILITHAHWDHLGAVADLASQTGAEVSVPAGEAEILADLPSWAPDGMGPWKSWDAEHRISGGTTIEHAGVEFEVLSVPGHSPDHLAYLIAGHGDDPPILVGGDVIFQGSVGRVDLPGSDPKTLGRTISMLRDRLDPATVILPGHGNVTTWQAELATNPFVTGQVALA